MIRLFTMSVALLLLGACASTSRYRQAGVGSGDYYYADSSGYYDRSADASSRYCSGDSRYAPYDPYGYADCSTPGWQWVGPYGYQDTWSGWGYPYTYYNNPYMAYGSRWSGSLWLGFGTGYSWGYPGYYNPWFGPWWPYAVTYPSYRRYFRNRQGLHRERALQASRPRYRGTTRSPGVQRQTGEMRRSVGLQRRTSTARPVSGRTTPGSTPTPSRSLPRGRPAAGIPVNWPVGHRASQPVQRAVRPGRPLPQQPRMVPREPSASVPSAGNDARITSHNVLSVPVSSRPAAQPRSQPMPVQRSRPAARPVLHSVPARPVVRSRAAAEALPAPAPRASHGSNRFMHSSMPRGRPQQKN